MSDGDGKLTRKAFLKAAALLGAATLAGTSRTIAQETTLARGTRILDEKGTRLVLLGTAGGPSMRKFRSQPSSMLVVDGAPYLFDVGYGALRQLSWMGFRAVDIEALFITHNHLDHNSDMAPIISFNWMQRRQRKLPIIGPLGTEYMARAAMEYFSVSERIFGAAKNGVYSPSSSFVAARDILSGGQVYKDERMTVIAAENSHYREFDPGQDKSFSYRVETKDRSIVFTGDTGYSDAVIALAKGADILVTEVIDADAVLARETDTAPDAKAMQQREAHMRREHLPPEDVGKMAAKAKVKMVVLTHFAPGVDSEISSWRYTERVRQYFKGPVIAGKDLLEI